MIRLISLICICSLLVACGNDGVLPNAIAQSSSYITVTPDSFNGTSPLSSTGVKEIGSINITTSGDRVKYSGTGYLTLSTHTTPPAYLQVTVTFYRDFTVLAQSILDINTSNISIGQFIHPLVWIVSDKPPAGLHTYKIKIAVDAYTANRQLVASIDTHFSYYHHQILEVVYD